jgi:hypothetical protein
MVIIDLTIVLTHVSILIYVVFFKELNLVTPALRRIYKQYLNVLNVVRERDRQLVLLCNVCLCVVCHCCYILNTLLIQSYMLITFFDYFFRELQQKKGHRVVLCKIMLYHTLLNILLMFRMRCLKTEKSKIVTYRVASLKSLWFLSVTVHSNDTLD